MSFRTDPQTLNDLSLLRRAGAPSVYELYDDARTRGGSHVLERMFLHPLTDAQQINRRSSIIQYFQSRELSFPFQAETLDRAEAYLAMTDERTMLSNADDTLRRKVTQWLSADGDYTVILHGIGAIAQIVQTFTGFVQERRPSAACSPYREDLAEIDALLRHEAFVSAGPKALRGKLSYHEVVDADKALRFRHRQTVQQLLEHIYRIDVYMSVAEVARKRRFVFPVALEKKQHCLKLAGVRHPLVNDAVGNDVAVRPERNLLFLTGANMAGKSTFMKSVAIAFYVAHLGFPVAAEAMEFSVADGLYTTINLPDDLNSGISHFYAEVMRIKQIAKELSGGRKLLVMFDELFRGTNVRDACEGTVAVTEAFAARADCMFVVSTHIIEAGEVLKGQCENIQFVFMPTRMEGTTPVYPYRMESGITSDRHGMVIINNERILEILRSRQDAPRHSEQRA